MYYYIVRYREQYTGCPWKAIGPFTTKDEAIAYGRAYAKTSPIGIVWYVCRAKTRKPPKA